MYICCLRPVIRCMSWFVSELHVQRWKWTMCVWLQSSQSCASEFPLNISNLHCLCTRFTFFTRLHSFVSLFPFCLIFQHVLLRFKSIVLHRSQVLFDRIYTWAVFTAATHHCCWCYCSSSMTFCFIRKTWYGCPGKRVTESHRMRQRVNACEKNRTHTQKNCRTKRINFCVKQRDDWFRASISITIIFFSISEIRMHVNSSSALKRHLFLAKIRS